MRIVLDTNVIVSGLISPFGGKKWGQTLISDYVNFCIGKNGNSTHLNWCINHEKTSPKKLKRSLLCLNQGKLKKM